MFQINYIYIYIYIYIYGEKVDIFGRFDKMMKNKWKTGYTKNRQYLILFFIDRTFAIEKKNFLSLAKKRK